MDEFNSYDWSGITYPTAYMHRLFDFARERKPERILEVGLDQGASALAFLRACPEAQLVSVDIKECPEACDRIRRAGVDDRFTLVVADSREYLPQMTREYDLVYIDGDHLYDAVKQDIENGAQLLAPGGVMILDDADPNHSHFGVYRAAMDFVAGHPGFVAQPLDGTPSQQLVIQRL